MVCVCVCATATLLMTFGYIRVMHLLCTASLLLSFGLPLWFPSTQTHAYTLICTQYNQSFNIETVVSVNLTEEGPSSLLSQ